MAVRKDKEHNVLNFLEYCDEKIETEELAYRMVQYMKNTARKNSIRNADELTKDRIQELEEEVAAVSEKLTNSFPTPLIILLCCFLISSIVSITLIILQLGYNFKVVDYYILLLVACASVGLFFTSISTIIEFRKKINEKK